MVLFLKLARILQIYTQIIYFFLVSLYIVSIYQPDFIGLLLFFQVLDSSLQCVCGSSSWGQLNGS